MQKLTIEIVSHKRNYHRIIDKLNGNQSDRYFVYTERGIKNFISSELSAYISRCQELLSYGVPLKFNNKTK